MGLFGALFAGVSGLNSQSNKIGIISNNISNVNTVGFKQGQGGFETLVVPSGTTTFSPGGVLGGNRQLVNQQGLISGTASPTDIAISGGGFFVVNTKADGSGTQLLTRAGSFTQDANGSFVNANGYYLMGVPLAGLTTALTSVNQSQLQVVSVNQNATGAASATSALTYAANFNAAQAVIPGSGELATLKNDAINKQNNASQIIVPTTGNGLVRGDSFDILSVTANHTSTYAYGGFTISRDVSSTINGTTTTGNGDGTTTLDTETVVGANIANAGGGSGDVAVTVANVADYAVGGYISLSGASAIGTIPAADVNGTHLVTSIVGSVVHFTASNSSTNTGAAATSSSSATVQNRSHVFTGNIMNATAAGGDLLAGITNPASVFTQSALSFKIATTGTESNTYTFTYSSQADPAQGQFNSLNSLVTAINNSTNGNLTASVQGGRLYVSASNANLGLDFTNGDAIGTGTLGGIDWVQEFDFPTTAITDVNAPVTTGSNIFRFNTLQGLADQINTNDPDNLIATVNNPTGVSTVDIREADPTSQITFTDGTANTGSSLLVELGFTGPNGGGLTPVASNQNTTTLPITYSATSAATDMSSGAVTPQFTKDITIFDALGNPHTVAMHVAKLGVNTWAVELAVVPAAAVSTVNGDGQIASGIVKFNTDGTLASVASELGASNSIASTVVINWTQTGPNAVGAAQSRIDVDLTRLVQSAGGFNVTTASQNGSPTGQLTGVTIDESGFVVQTFSNGQTQRAFQIPLASVNNPNGLEPISGNAYQGTLASGTINYNLAGAGGTGTISPSSLEQSNVDISTQLTDLIVAQQAYGANSKVLTVTDRLLQQLDQIIQ